VHKQDTQSRVHGACPGVDGTTQPSTNTKKTFNVTPITSA